MEDMIRLYERTYKNCLFYQSEGRKVELLNEIGVLRGIVYPLSVRTTCTVSLTSASSRR
ncbi:MAG: hypothetical protein IJI19_07415 [Ruminococcus sp.]|nr:hypothetical protein [Ruminococcus sp.]